MSTKTAPADIILETLHTKGFRQMPKLWTTLQDLGFDSPHGDYLEVCSGAITNVVALVSSEVWIAQSGLFSGLTIGL